MITIIYKRERELSPLCYRTKAEGLNYSPQTYDFDPHIFTMFFMIGIGFSKKLHIKQSAGHTQDYTIGRKLPDLDSFAEIDISFPAQPWCFQAMPADYWAQSQKGGATNPTK